MAAYKKHGIKSFNMVLNHLILNGMKKYQMKSVMVTSIDMVREKLITKEKMVNYCNGKEDEQDSINDDLELLFDDLRLGKEPDEYDRRYRYFLPKLTEQELELVDKKDPTYFASFTESTSCSNTVYPPRNPDVEEAEMKASESNSKFVLAKCYRNTYTIENSSPLNCFHSCSLQ